MTCQVTRGGGGPIRPASASSSRSDAEVDVVGALEADAALADARLRQPLGVLLGEVAASVVHST